MDIEMIRGIPIEEFLSRLDMSRSDGTATNAGISPRAVRKGHLRSM